MEEISERNCRQPIFLAHTVEVHISSEEYQSDLHQGLTEDETLSPGRHLFRRGGFLQRHPFADITNMTIAEVPASIP